MHHVVDLTVAVFIIKFALALKWLLIFEMCWSVSKNLGMYEIKTSYHGKCLNDFYSPIAMHQKTHSFTALTHSSFFDVLLLINKNHLCSPPME